MAAGRASVGGAASGSGVLRQDLRPGRPARPLRRAAGMNPQLFPKPAKRMRQPRKDVLRDELARAAAEIERLRTENERLRRPWWRRLITRTAASTRPKPAMVDRSSHQCSNVETKIKRRTGSRSCRSGTFRSNSCRCSRRDHSRSWVGPFATRLAAITAQPNAGEMGPQCSGSPIANRPPRKNATGSMPTPARRAPADQAVPQSVPSSGQVTAEPSA